MCCIFLQGSSVAMRRLHIFVTGKMTSRKAVVVAQLVERLLLTPEVRGLNPVIGKIYIER